MLKLVLLLLLVAWLAHYVVVTIKGHRGLIGVIEFNVDGTRYSLFRYVIVNRRGSVVSSSLLVTPRSEAAEWHTRYDSRRGATIVQTHPRSGQMVIAETDTVSFVQGGKIIFAKRYRELGLDASRLNADHEVMLDYLQPIFEEMIRENIQPQVPELEEQ